MLSVDLINWTLVKFLSLLVIMTRVGPLIFLMPITGSNTVPVQVKAMFTLMTSLILLSIVNLPQSALPSSTIGFSFGSTLQKIVTSRRATPGALWYEDAHARLA